jgi:hypothetical protein
MKKGDIREFFQIAMDFKQEAKGWWRRHLIQSPFTAAQKVS